MRQILQQYLAVVLLTWCPLQTTNAQNGADAMLNDLAIPLMDGLIENDEASMLFDSPEGRIINAAASGAVSGEKIHDYYRVVLPSLGWEVRQGVPCEGSATYCLSAVREEENLTMSIEVTDDKSTVTYSLSPN